MTNSDTHCCPICAEPFKPEDICATDISEGTCHAECLEGSPVVDLETGEETGGKVDTYPYSEVMDPSPATNSRLSKWSGWDQSNPPWSEAKHKDRVCYAAFGDAWSMEDAAVLIGFIETTWSRTTASEGSADA